MTRGLTDRLAHTRRHLAGFLGADPDGSALVANATTGVALVLHSLDLSRGDEVLTAESGYGAVDFACDARGLRRRPVPLELTAGDDEIAGAVVGAAVPSVTRLAIVDLVSSATARRMPVERIAAGLREKGVPLLVDGAHGPGMLPLSVGDLGADFFVGNLHKWAYAPRSTAIFTVAPRWRSAIRPLVVSWEQNAGFPGNVEFAGTQDYTGWLAAPAGLFALRALGVDRVRTHNADLARYAQQTIGAALGVPASQLPDPGGPVAMRVVPLPGRLPGSQEAALALRERIVDELHTVVAVNAYRGRLLLRLCGQVYNQPGEYERLAADLPALLKNAGA